MKKVAIFVGLVLLISVTCNVFCSGPSGKRGHPRNIPEGPVTVYDNRGQLQQTIKRDSSGIQTIYDNRGQLQQTIKRDSSGNEKVYDNRGQLQESIKLR
jgi:YD repeat-containing protein